MPKPKTVWFKKPGVIAEMLEYFERILREQRECGSLCMFGRSNGNEALLIEAPLFDSGGVGWTCQVEKMPLPLEYQPRATEGWVTL